MKVKASRSYKISELLSINSNIENLMISPALGIEKSLILHSNKKLLKNILEDVNAKIEVMQKQSYKTTEEGKLDYDGKGQLIPLEGKAGEFRRAYDSLMEVKQEVVFHPICIDELPSSKDFGQINNVELYQFVPPLFDVILFSKTEYDEIKSQIK